MEISKFLSTIFVVAYCGSQQIAESKSVSLKKSAGQLLDETFLLLKRDFQTLNNVDDALKKKVERLSEPSGHKTSAGRPPDGPFKSQRPRPQGGR